VRRAEELRFGPLLVRGQAFAEVAGARQEERRPATAARAWTGEAVHRWRAGELLVRAMHAETVQPT
jgi:hypothetical protein